MTPEHRHHDLRAALAKLQGGAFGDAVSIVARWHRRDPGDVEASLLFGLAAAGAGDAEAGAAVLERVARLRPEAAHPASDLIGLLDRAKQHQRIAPYLDAALALAPADHRLLSDAGNWWQQVGAAERALGLLERALAVRPGYAPARLGKAAALADLGAFDAAIGLVRGVIAEGAGGAAAYSNLGTMLAKLDRFDEADAAFRAARRLDPRQPQIGFNHGMTLLRAGRLEEGWPAFNIRLLLPGHSVLPVQGLLPRLAPGARLDGRTVLVTHDAGFGDTLQFIRYVPLLAARGARVLVWVPPALERLIGTVAGVAAVFSDDRAWPAYDWHCPVMRLPEVFGTTLATVPGEVPYLRALPDDVAQWALRLPAREGRRIGLVWAGSAREGNPQMQAVDRRRSIAPGLLGPLFEVPGVQWVSLQLGRPGEGLPVFDPMPQVGDFADTAAVIVNLDAVVSVDTAVAHLAGALGTTVYLLDRFDNCWRWLSGRADSPWYPATRIFRQERWGDWSGAVRRVAEAVAADGAASRA